MRIKVMTLVLALAIGVTAAIGLDWLSRFVARLSVSAQACGGQVVDGAPV